MRWPPVILLYRSKSRATSPMAISWAGVISPPGHAGHDGVRAVALDVGEEVVVGVLQAGLLAVEDVARRQRGEHRRHRRLADLAAAPLAEAGDELGERADAGDPHDLEQLGAGHREVGAEALDDGLARRGQAGVDQLLQHRHARAAAGAGLRAALDRRRRPRSPRRRRPARRRTRRCGTSTRRPRRAGRPGRVPAAPAVGRSSPSTSGDLARCRARPARASGTAWCRRRARRRGPGRRAPTTTRCHVPVAGSATTTSSPLGVRVAGAGDVDAEQLQRRRQVGAGERGVAAGEAVGDDLGHAVARGDEAVDPPAVAGDLADRVHVRRRRGAAVVDDDAAALADLPGRPRGRAGRAAGRRRRTRPCRRRGRRPRRTTGRRPGRRPSCARRPRRRRCGPRGRAPRRGGAAPGRRRRRAARPSGGARTRRRSCGCPAGAGRWRPPGRAARRRRRRPSVASAAHAWIASRSSSVR